MFGAALAGRRVRPRSRRALCQSAIAFPWRQESGSSRARPASSFLESLLGTVRDGVASHFLRICAPSPAYFDTDFLVGATKAVQSLQFVFPSSNSADTPSATHASSNAREETHPAADTLNTEASASADSSASQPKAAETSAASPISIADAFESNLAKFYQEALAKSAEAGLRVRHSIASIGPISVDRHDVIFNANRSMAKEMRRMVRNDFMSVIGNAEPVDIEDTQSYPAECLTGKVWVSFTCSEVFFVERVSTGEVVQGSREPVPDALHEVVLECCLHSTARTFLSDWKIVDVDGWLKGNDFLSYRQAQA